MQERLVTLEVLLKEVLRRLDTEVSPRHSDHEARLRAAEATLSDVKTRVALVASGTGGGVGLLAALVTHYLGGGS